MKKKKKKKERIIKIPQEIKMPEIVEPELEPETPIEKPEETPVVETPQDEIVEQPAGKQSITYNGKVATRLNRGDTETEYHCSISDGSTQHLPKSLFK
jgi:hypothetical protein